MSEKQNKFLIELGELFDKYGVKVYGYDDYDESKNYIGTYYVLNGDGISVSAGNLMEAIARTNNVFTRHGCMKIKSGDIVQINSRTYWICDCNNAPLNNLNNEECDFCNRKRPTQAAESALEKKGETMPSTMYCISYCIRRILAAECKDANLSQRVDDIAESLWIASSKSLADAHRYLIDLRQKAEAGRYIEQ